MRHERKIRRGPVLDAEGVADLLNYNSAAYFHSRRTALESHGFPKRLPGINGWSRPCILRWLQTNGATHLPADLPHALSGGDLGIALRSSLEGEYGQ